MSWKQMKMLSYWVLTAPVIFLSAIWIGGAAAAEGDADLAQELSNPIADLITLPIQMNYDRGIGPRDDG